MMPELSDAEAKNRIPQLEPYVREILAAIALKMIQQIAGGKPYEIPRDEPLVTQLWVGTAKEIFRARFSSAVTEEEAHLEYTEFYINHAFGVRRLLVPAARIFGAHLKECLLSGTDDTQVNLDQRVAAVFTEIFGC